VLQPVRRRITEILKSQGSATVAELAGALGMAQVSVRHHLDILIGEDLVQASGLRRREGAGRPSQVYELTEQAAVLFPQRHAMLAADMLGELESTLPGPELRSMLQRLGEKTARLAPQPSPDASLEEQLAATAEFLTGQGYSAHWEQHDGVYELYACNCPYAGVAEHHPELCLMDLAMVQHLMPDMIRLESRVLDGSSLCRYVVRHARHSEAGA
jgi:predicted ArsR family transcriptional regulator